MNTTIKRLVTYILNKTKRVWTDKVFLKLKYYLIFNKNLNLKKPQSYNEKLQWLKLNDHNPLYTKLVDKYAVKNYVKEKIGKEYIIPTIGVWKSPDEIDFSQLPNKFVIKCNHNSGQGLTICTNKADLDIEKLKEKLRKALNNDYYLQSREWPYKNVERKIIAEQYLEDTTAEEGDLKDYKLMCFNGKVKCSFVCSERKTNLKVTFFDKEWNRLPFERHYPQSTKKIEKPINYERMIQLAEILATGIPFVRVDFYEVKGQIYFGEMTFFPGAGFEEFTPDEWDYTLGSWIDINKRIQA